MHTNTHTHAHTHTSMNACIHTYTGTHMHTHACIHTYMHTHACMHACMHTYTCMSKNTYTHTHTHTPAASSMYHQQGFSADNVLSHLPCNVSPVLFQVITRQEERETISITLSHTKHTRVSDPCLLLLNKLGSAKHFIFTHYLEEIPPPPPPQACAHPHMHACTHIHTHTCMHTHTHTHTSGKGNYNLQWKVSWEQIRNNEICLPDVPGQGIPQGRGDISEGSRAISLYSPLAQAHQKNDSLPDRREQVSHV